MSSQTNIRVKLGRGTSIKFLLSKKPRTRPLEQTNRPPQEQDNALFPVDRGEDFLVSRPTEKYLRIFDMGRNFEGDDFSDFLIQPDFPYGTPGIPPPEPVLSDFATRDSFLFSVPGETFFDKFYEIRQSDGDLYRLTLANDDDTEILISSSDKWTANGVKLPNSFYSASNFVAYSDYIGGYNYRLNFFNSVFFDVFKVTDTYDYDDDEIDFELLNGDSLFLVPALCSFYGRSVYFFGGQQVFLNDDFRFGLRSFYDGNLTPSVDPSQEDAVNGYTNAYDAAQYHINLLNARAFHWEYDFDNNTDLWTEVDPEDFTINPPFSPSTPPSGAYTLKVDITNFGTPSGTLVAIVKRSSETFYIWKV